MKKTYTEESLVALLKGNPSLTLSQICESLGCGKSTAENLTDRAIRAGLIRREATGPEKRPLYLYKVR